MRDSDHRNTCSSILNFISPIPTEELDGFNEISGFIAPDNESAASQVLTGIILTSVFSLVNSLDVSIVMGLMVTSIALTDVPKMPKFTEAGNFTLGGNGKNLGNIKDKGILIPCSSIFTDISDFSRISEESSKLVSEELDDEPDLNNDNSKYLKH